MSDKNTDQEYAGIAIRPPMVKCRNVRNGLYPSPSIYCALRSPQRYTTRDVPSWVAHGLILWARAYPEKAADKGPNRSHRGRGDTSAAVATDDPSLLLTVEGLSADLSTPVDFWRFEGEKSCWCRWADRLRTRRAELWMIMAINFCRSLLAEAGQESGVLVEAG